MPRLTFGLRLRVAREHYGLTQQELADKLDATFWSTVSKWETDTNRPSVGYLAKFAKALRDKDTRLNVDWLVTGEGSMTLPR